jgi:hypothetical protein
MSFVESPLCRLQLSFGEFIEPSATPWDVDALKTQIELRQQALAEIELIRRRLRLFMSCEKQRLSIPRPRKSRVSRSRLVGSARARVPVRQPIRSVSII